MTRSGRPQQGYSRLASERRDDPRVAVDLKAELTSAGFSHPLRVEVRDLSAGGACVVTDCPIALSEALSLRMYWKGRALSLSAEALWQEKRQDAFYMGIRFVEPRKEEQRLLMEPVFDATRSIVDFIVFESSLTGIGRGDALHLAGASRLRVLDSGIWLYSQDRPSPDSESIFIVMEGSIRIRTRVRERERDLADLGRGAVFGGVPALAGIDPPESAIVLQPARLLEVDVRATSHLLEQRPWLVHRLSHAIVGDYARRMRRLLEVVAA